MVVTIAERRRARLAGLLEGVAVVKAVLSDYARLHGGHFIIFGSVARGQAGPDSDLDILVDFPEASGRAAWFFAETTCIAHGVRPDIHLRSETTAALVARAEREGERLA